MKRRKGASSRSLASYILERQKRPLSLTRGEAGPKGRKGNISIPGRTTGQTGLEINRDDDAVRVLMGRIVEKEDLIHQIGADDELLGESVDGISQDAILEALEALGEDKDIDLRAISGSMQTYQGIRCSREEARARLARVQGEILSLAGRKGVAALYKSELEARIDVVLEARKVEHIRRLLDKAALARLELLTRRHSEGAALTGADTDTLLKYRVIREKGEEHIRKLMARDEVYYEVKRRMLLEYRRQLLRDGFAETESVKDAMMNIISHVKLGIPVLLRGHLGAGKTEMALHVCRRYFGCEPEFISGSEEATKYDIYGKTQIGIRSEHDRLDEFSRRMNEYSTMNPRASRKELKEIENRYYQEIVVKGLTASFFEYGPLIRATREGKPLIIDEMDGIPHSIIMRLNHVLTRRPGDAVRVQEGGGEEIIVRKGFCVLATGNIKSARYRREDLDAAFLSRWWSLDIEYPPENETYEIMVASLLDKRGNLQVKNYADLDALKRLTQAAAEIQRIFSGEQVDYYGEGADAAREISASLKKTVLSLRHLWNIVRPWKANNFDKPLDAYIFREFIKPAVAEDQIYLVQLCSRFRFFKEWKARDFAIPGLTEEKVLAFRGKKPRDGEE